MSTRYCTHLADVVRQTGTGDGTVEIVGLIETGLKAAREAEQAQRAAKGKELKINPYVSDAAKCFRAVWFSLRNEPESNPVGPDSLMNFAVGHAVEEALANVLEAQGLTVLREVRVEIPAERTIVSGRADFLVVLLPHLLIELKATNSRAMGFMLRNGDKGRHEHRLQAGKYLHATHLGLMRAGDVVVPPLDSALLVYIVKDATKNEPIAHGFRVNYDEFTKAQVERELRRLAQIKKLADENTDPGRPEGMERRKYPCAWCSWVDRCWS